ncbi:MAG TPA: hypothetical protein VLA78_00620 [Paracoccaceae bacterium]|nr:hypothetical protein [Paracoccaceae bacterium]
MTDITSTAAAQPRKTLATRVRALLHRIVAADAHHRAAHRLAALSDEHLADMGMTRATARRAFDDRA